MSRIVLSEVLHGQVTRDALEMRLLRLAARRFREESAGEFEVALLRLRIAAERREVDEFLALDKAFRRMICDASGYPNGWRTIHAATGQLERVLRHAFPAGDRYGEVLEEGRAIFERLRRRDEEGAAAIFQVQLDRTFPALGCIGALDPDWVLHDVGHPGVEHVR